MHTALEARYEAARAGHQEGVQRAWRLFCLLPKMLLHRPRREGWLGKETLCDRFDNYARGKWAELLASARAAGAPHREGAPPAYNKPGDGMARRGAAAQAKVKHPLALPRPRPAKELSN